ncbi:MAG: chemotaxis protein CheW [Deltaproteobacteria bacterium]|nr:chemotaxis protein CheW [Deltaproteobacteria bacterium]
MDTSKYKALYLQETSEHISGIEKGLLALEKGDADATTVDHLFRHYHSIKGMSASMGYEPIQKLAHAQEDLLDRIRQKRMTATPTVTDALLRCLDGLKALLKRVEDGGALNLDIAPLYASIKDAIEGRLDQAAMTAPAAGRPAAGRPAPDAAAPGASGAAELKLSHVMKVEGKVFDDLMATVGDLIMALSTFKAISHGSRSIELKEGVYMLGKHINALHNNILSARMLPIEDLTEGLPRVIRDMSQKSGKEVELRIEGASLRLDRSTLEGLGAPLVHIIRNCVDHGIESVDERLRAGKPRSGVIQIKAYSKRDKVIIEVSDDGRGINAARIKEKARARGVAEERLRAMTDKDALMLVCLPGVSGADVVTDTSGRGVGMDVVKGVVEGLGGAIGISTVPGAGTRIDMELPLTTSIIKALLVTEGPELFLLPISRIERVLEVHRNEISGGRFSYDGAVVPVISLGAALGMAEAPERDYYSLIIVHGRTLSGVSPAVEAETREVAAIRVDAFGDEIDAYIRPLAPPISRLWGASGITVMGDGRAVFLLDVSQIVSKALLTA